MATPFSYECLDSMPSVTLQQSRSVRACDGVSLAYYAFEAPRPTATLVFYHGGGAWSNALYQKMALDLQTQGVSTYLFDIRGHGHSSGPRGDAPSFKQIWRDITTAIEFVHAAHPDLPLFLGGHSSGGGLVANYAQWTNNPLVSGYVFVAPYWGVQYGLAYEHRDPEKRFVKDVRLFPLITSAITRGFFFGNTPVIFFNYSDAQKQKDPLLLEYYTSNMALAVTPHHDPKKFFDGLDKPFLLLAGERDEQFISEKIIACGSDAAQKSNLSHAILVPRATHLSIVLELPQFIRSLI